MPTEIRLKEISTIEDADRLFDSAQPVWLFKHSAACAVSFMAMASVNQYLRSNPVAAAMIVVQQSRAVSNHVAARSGVEHETPQVLLVGHGRVLWHTSHSGITAEAMEHAWAAAADT